MAMEESKVTKNENIYHSRKFVGYADITIEAETEDEAISLYNRDTIKIVTMM